MAGNIWHGKRQTSLVLSDFLPMSAKVVHFALHVHAFVINCPKISYICMNAYFLYNKISMLDKCLKNRQINERRVKQGKFPVPEIFSAVLSTETVDSFALASVPFSLQLIHRINAHRIQVLS